MILPAYYNIRTSVCLFGGAICWITWGLGLGRRDTVHLAAFVDQHFRFVWWLLWYRRFRLSLQIKLKLPYTMLIKDGWWLLINKSKAAICIFNLRINMFSLLFCLCSNFSFLLVLLLNHVSDKGLVFLNKIFELFIFDGKFVKVKDFIIKLGLYTLYVQFELLLQTNMLSHIRL